MIKDPFAEMLDAMPAKGAKKPNPETALQKEIVSALRALNLWVVRIPGQGTMQHVGPGRAVLKASELAGFPDLLVLGPEGLTAWLEVKTPAGRLSPPQKARHDRLAALSHTVAVVRSADQAVSVLRDNGWFDEPLILKGAGDS